MENIKYKIGRKTKAGKEMWDYYNEKLNKIGYGLYFTSGIKQHGLCIPLYNLIVINEKYKETGVELIVLLEHELTHALLFLEHDENWKEHDKKFIKRGKQEILNSPFASDSIGIYFNKLANKYV